LTAFDPALKLPTVHEWNVGIQHELPKGFVVQIGYVGRRGTHLFRAYDLNQIDAAPILGSFKIMQQNVSNNCLPDGSGTLDPTKPACYNPQTVPLVTSGVLKASFVNSSTTLSDLATTANAAGNFAGRIEQTTLAAHLRPNQQFGVITYLDAGGDSYYHSLQLTVRKRFTAGLLLWLAYSFSKSIDDQSVDPVGAASGGGLSPTNSRTPIDIRNWRNERALSDFDRTHVITANFVYDLPIGKGQHLWNSAPSSVNYLIGGWSVNGLYTYMSGEPFS